MSADLKSCYDDEDAENAARTIASPFGRYRCSAAMIAWWGIVSPANLTQTRDVEAKREFLESIASPH
ncbi:hypothetical protein ACQQ2N_04570 [Dokdonella sp. MW10]|uniref:hypothetical protein n=1 Tax=Dokdonella sp. MW10 TaxID=2992926 RepID=UPI003F815669